MFLTCQVDLPVAITMKSAQSQGLFPGKTLTLSALTSLRIFSTSWSSRSPALLEMAADAERLWLKLENPSFHCWRSEEDEEDDDDEKQEDLDRRTVHMESSLSRAVTGFALQPFSVASFRPFYFAQQNALTSDEWRRHGTASFGTFQNCLLNARLPNKKRLFRR